MTIKEIIAENEKRVQAQHGEYDPYAGIGSPIERVPVPLGGSVVTPLGNRITEVLVPVQMYENDAATREAASTSLNAFAEKMGVDFSKAEAAFNQTRLKYDYEFWCATCVVIEDRDTSRLIPFIMRRPQRQSFADREAMRVEGKPIRQIECKHRQYGSTTEKNAYIGWLQNEVYDGRHAWMISLVKGGAAEIARRYDLIAENYPKWAGTVTLEGVRNAQNTRRIRETGSLVSIASVNNPQGPSGYTAHFIIVSEAGKMGSSEMQSAERLITNVMSMVPLKPGTAVMVESTAERVGDWFRTEVEKGQRGDSAYKLTFTSWMQDEQCQLPVDGINMDRWIPSWDDYLKRLWDEHGATLEQIRWYEVKRKEYPEAWMMMQENPTTIDEAFQFGGKRVFAAPHVQTAKKTCKDPIKRGRLVADAVSGPGAFQNIRFEDDPKGPLKIWRLPDDNYGGLLKHPVSQRHIAAADIGPGKWEGADFNVCAVLDRAPVLVGGLPEIVSEWHGHLDKDLFAWEAARLSFWYGKALLAVEVNSLIEDNETRYEAGQTVLDEIIGAYPNLYMRRVMDSFTQKAVDKAGFHMNAATKEQVISSLVKRLRETHESIEKGAETIEGYIERCHEATHELDIYQIHEDGSMGATSRAERSSKTKKDDRVIVRAILAWLHGEIRLPSYILPEKRPVRRGSMASFS